MARLIIFDYDGVIVDSLKCIHMVYKIICKELGKKCPDKIEDFKKIYGYNFLECYKNLGIEEEEYGEAIRIFEREILKQEPELFEGVTEVIKELSKKYALVVVSASYREEVIQKLKQFKLVSFFENVYATAKGERISCRE